MAARKPECLWRMQIIERKDKSHARIARFITPDCEGHDFLEKHGCVLSDPWNPLDFREAITCTTNKGAIQEWGQITG